MDIKLRFQIFLCDDAKKLGGHLIHCPDVVHFG